MESNRQLCACTLKIETNLTDVRLKNSHRVPKLIIESFCELVSVTACVLIGVNS